MKIKDLMGKSIKNILDSFQQQHIEKFYIYNNKIFQIIRIDKIPEPNKMSIRRNFVHILFKNVITSKINSTIITFDVFNERICYSLYKNVHKKLIEED